MPSRHAPPALAAWLLAACSAGTAAQPPAPTPAAPPVAPSPPAPPPPPTSTAFRLRVCTAAPIRLQGPPGAQQSRGCVATFTQALSDPAAIRSAGAPQVTRRYIVYAPPHLPPTPTPIVFMFPGYSASAEAAAFYYTHMSFERLADRDGFIVVYGNGLPTPPATGEKPSMPEGGFLQGCLAPHTGEGIDVSYVRQIVDQLSTEVNVDRSRIYDTGLSAGGGWAFPLALEARGLVAAITPVEAFPFQPTGVCRHHRHPNPGHERVSIAMLAATHDRFVSYAPGGSAEYPQARYPGMEQTRDAWLAAMGIRGAPPVE